jgi:hypothetical protein
MELVFIVRELPCVLNNIVADYVGDVILDKKTRCISLTQSSFDQIFHDEKTEEIYFINYDLVEHFTFDTFVNLRAVFGAPNIKTASLSELFANLKNFEYADFHLWDTSGVKDMSKMFYKSSVNCPVWFDTRNVIDMNSMFMCAANFNSPVQFDTRNVLDMTCMFRDAVKFNHPVRFDTRKVLSMQVMFCGAESFNQEVRFDTSSVEFMSGMFYGAVSFNKEVPFNTKNVLDMRKMFYKARLFDQKVQFDVSNVIRMCMLFGCTNMSYLPEWYKNRLIYLNTLPGELTSANTNSMNYRKKEARDIISQMLKNI